MVEGGIVVEEVDNGLHSGREKLLIQQLSSHILKVETSLIQLKLPYNKMKDGNNTRRTK